MLADVSHNQYGVPKYAGQTMDKAHFLRWESDDNYVYEFSNGALEPTTSMRQDEVLLFKLLTRHFSQTEAYQAGSELLAEVDVWLTDKQMRRPDIAYYTASQLGMITIGELVIPSFVVELASESDNDFKNVKKLHEYFEAGIQVVWWVYPLYQEVYVYTSPKTVSICTDDDRLSAAPALPELQITVAQLFKR